MIFLEVLPHYEHDIIRTVALQSVKEFLVHRQAEPEKQLRASVLVLVQGATHPIYRGSVEQCKAFYNALMARLETVPSTENYVIRQGTIFVE